VARRRRRVKRRSSAKKTWRFIQKQRRRRAKMHPTRRKQENLALIGGLSSIVLLVLLGPAWFAFSITAAGGNLLASKATPPKTTHRPRRVKDTGKDDEKYSGWFTHKQAQALIKKKPCDKTCKNSTHPPETCDCSCRGKNHGILAGLNRDSTTPNKRRPATRRPARRRVRSRR